MARMVLLTLPYIAVSPKNPIEALDSIVERLSTYMDSRDTNETSYVTPFATPNEDVPPPSITWTDSDSLWEISLLYIYFGYKRKLSRRINGTFPSFLVPGSLSARNWKQIRKLILFPTLRLIYRQQLFLRWNQNTTSPCSSPTRNRFPPSLSAPGVLTFHFPTSCLSCWWCRSNCCSQNSLLFSSCTYLTIRPSPNSPTSPPVSSAT